jgi:DNA-binding response OmpR family regulator
MSGKQRILLVDDEPSIVKMVGKRLEVEGFDVLIAMDGQEAVKLAQTEKPDLMILDLMLPKLNGYEVCSLLKQDERYKKIPIIMFSAKAQEKDEKLGIECGADAYIRKPFKAQELLDQIRTLLKAVSPDNAAQANSA